MKRLFIHRLKLNFTAFLLCFSLVGLLLIPSAQSDPPNRVSTTAAAAPSAEETYTVEDGATGDSALPALLLKNRQEERLKIPPLLNQTKGRDMIPKRRHLFVTIRHVFLKI